jgi:hypothetical protein
MAAEARSGLLSAPKLTHIASRILTRSETLTSTRGREMRALSVEDWARQAAAEACRVECSKAGRTSTCPGTRPYDVDVGQPDPTIRHLSEQKSCPPARRKHGDQAGAAAAMIDRVVHHADVLTLKGASYGLRNRGIDTLPSIRNQDTTHSTAKSRY